MIVGQRLAERRKSPRYKVENRAYVVNVARPGLIADISPRGLSWHYIERKTWPEENPTLDIVSDDLEFSLEQLPYEVVSDYETGHEWPDPSLRIRRRSVRFGNLTAQQLAGLEEIICWQQLEEPPLMQLSIAS